MFHVRGDPFASLIPHSTPNGLVEFPLPVLKGAGFTYPFALATVFRITPYPLTSWMLRAFCRRNDSPAMVSIHPWDFDIDQPKLELPLKTYLMKYIGMRKMRGKLDRLLSDYPVVCTPSSGGGNSLVKRLASSGIFFGFVFAICFLVFPAVRLLPLTGPIFTERFRLGFLLASFLPGLFLLFQTCIFHDALWTYGYLRCCGSSRLAVSWWMRTAG